MNINYIYLRNFNKKSCKHEDLNIPFLEYGPPRISPISPGDSGLNTRHASRLAVYGIFSEYTFYCKHSISMFTGESGPTDLFAFQQNRYIFKLY